MFCRSVRNDLSAYLQNELEPGRARLVELHLKQCSVCRAELQKIQEGIQAAERLNIEVAPEDLWLSVEQQIQRRQLQREAAPKRAFAGRLALACGVVIFVALLIWYFGTERGNHPQASGALQWSVNASVLEACSCPMFCQCYFNTKPAGHAHHGMEEHFCRTNIAYRINKGRFGAESLDGAKFWLAADVGPDFSAGQTEWAVLYFDPSLNARQREGVQTILSHLMPVKWKSFQTAEATIDRWEVNNSSAYASLDSGNAGVIKLKSLQSGPPIIIRNLKYWAAPRNDGFLPMHNEVEAYRVGPKAFEFKNSAGLYITFDMNSNDVKKGPTGLKSGKGM